MKKQISAVLIAVMLCSCAFAADTSKTNSVEFKNPPTKMERPKLYDANGNELTTPPKEGQTVYDANGNELKRPPMRGNNSGMRNMQEMNGAEKMKRPTLYDKDGNELTTPPSPNQEVYDKNGNKLEIKPPKDLPQMKNGCPPPPRFQDEQNTNQQ